MTGERTMGGCVMGCPDVKKRLLVLASASVEHELQSSTHAAIWTLC